MKHCQYCGQTATKLDEFGYCVRYSCFSVSGRKAKLESLVTRARNLLFVSDSYRPLSIKSWVSNGFSERTREANHIIFDTQKEFGFVPRQVLDLIPMKNRQKWDKDIRW